LPTDLRRETLNIQIANIIKQEIIQGILKQGERLDLKKLIERFQVSSIPIREALKKLESEGFIESASRRGYFVRSYSDRDIEEIGEARLMVESYCLSNYFDLIDRKTLKDIYDFMENFPGTALDEYIGKDFNFHNLIVESSKNDFIINFYRSLQEKIHFFMSIQEDLDTFRAQHLQIMQYIFSGDKNKATKILREHILYSTQVIKTKLFHLKSDKKKNNDYNGKK
jgi:DNA-binding GntR family transcriptional regulator